MAASTTVTFWAYNWYLINNPHKQFFTKEDIVRMARKFAATNSSEITDATDPGSTYTDIEWPDQAGAGSVTAVGNSSTDRTGLVSWDVVDAASKVTLDQAQWPETMSTTMA